MPGKWFLSTLTAIHALGSLALAAMTVYVLGGTERAEDLARTPGARLMVDLLGPRLPLFLGGLAVFFALLAWGTRGRRRWAWFAAVFAYSVGVAGSLWEVSIGIPQAWVSAAINAGVVAMLLSERTRRAYFFDRPLPRSRPT